MTTKKAAKKTATKAGPVARSVDWVEQAIDGPLLWRQAKREAGQHPVQYTDRSSDHYQYEEGDITQPQDRYSEAQKKQLQAIWKPLASALEKRYKSLQWWHYDHPSGTLVYSIGQNERAVSTATDLIKLADSCFEKFTTMLSDLHGATIVPARA